MKKLKEIIERWIYDGKAPRGMTPYMVDVLIGVYRDLCAGRPSCFIQEEVGSLLRRCGIPVERDGIGWAARNPDEMG